MKKQKGFTVIELILVIIVVLGAVAWCGNLYKLTQCDFESDYKCEVIHGIGVIGGPASLVTVWFGTDE